MTAKLRVFFLLMIAVLVTGNLPAQEPPSGCPLDLETLRSGWGTTPEIGHVIEVRAWLTFTNTVGTDIDFGSDPYGTLQIWSIPDGLEPETITFNASPAGSIVPPGEDFSYDVTIGIANLPLSQTGLVFRPNSHHPGTLSPGRSEFVSAAFECVEGRRGTSAIPAMSSWSRIALLLVVLGSAVLVVRRRFS